jgi:isopentenyl diphosphate isomerase/L-lactate dehydrogenase-like FMN-dependent dehydrogenase
MKMSSYSRGDLVVVVAAAVTAQVVTTSMTLLWWRKHRSMTNDADEDDNDDEFMALQSQIPPKSILDFEKAARKHLAPLSKTYFQFFADQAVTATSCRTFYNSIRMLPRILRGDLEVVDTSLEIFGTTLQIPVLLAPSAFHVLACPDGEIATAKGASAAGAGYCYNFMLSSKLYTDVLAAAPNSVKWLHLYMFEEKDLVVTSIKAAMATDAFSAIILTCDHPHTRVQGRMMPYFSKGDFPHSDHDDPFFPNQAAVGFDNITLRQLKNFPNTKNKSTSNVVNPGGTNSSKLSWDDVKWIQSLVNGPDSIISNNQKKKIPIVAKGILSAADARKAVEVGVDAIVVSNHGGRQTDIAVPAIEALPAVVAAVNGTIPVFVDSGVRTSGDIVRALCLGATGVLLGRPPLWALACEGSTGLERMLETLKKDLQDDMRSLGVKSLPQLNMDCLWPPDQERIRTIVESCGEKLLTSK